MSKKDLYRELESLLKTKRDHEEKKQQSVSDPNRVRWLEKEIMEMDRRISDLKSRLNSSEEECPNCRKMVIPQNNSCPKCGSYMG